MNWAGTAPPWVSNSDGVVEAKLRGRVTAPAQAASAGAVVAGLLCVAPAYAGLVTVVVPLLVRSMRSAAAPAVVLGAESLVVTAGGPPSSRTRASVRGAGVARESGAWVLRVDADGGPLTVTDHGMSPNELQWLADTINAWRVGLRELPPMPERVVDAGVGETTFSFASGMSAADWGITAALAAVCGAAAVFDLPGELVLGPLLGAVGGHLVGSRRAGRVEVRVTPHSVRIERTDPRIESHTVALEDLDRVQVDGDWVTLVERGGARHVVRATGGATSLADAITRARDAVPTPTPEVEAARRSERAAVAAMAARSRQREG